MDKIIIKDLCVHAFHGVNPEEREKGQPFIFTITCYLDLSRAAASDAVEDTVSYAQVIKLVKRTATARANNLLESTAAQTADAILQAFPAVKRVDVLLKKPRAPILADFGYVAVELIKER
ncbi:MAG: dihydroneopterin aldolase [Clostridiales bacterium]|nr:dihydroneopterin aldolase [Clostridiales bacterium]